MKKKLIIFSLLFIILVIILLACIIVFTRKSTDNNLLVSLPVGQIQGATYVTKTGKTYYGFRGIPYAKPPLGALRYEPPQPVERWNGILNASTDGKACISLEYSASAQSEDCLFINVYVPIIGGSENMKLPVMFWIHGGGLIANSSNKAWNGPDFLIEKNIVMVSINYRLGPLSFLSTGDSNLPGNLGFKDQVLAMEWVRDNIEHFGGDPDKVTIFGQSAGAISVGVHLVSKRSAGLFRAAILQSGSAAHSWAVEQNPRTVAFELANKIPGGFYENDTRALKDFLKSKSVGEILNATYSLSSAMTFWPITIEPESDEAFLTESPYVSLESGNFNRVATIIGITAEESAYFLNDLNGTQSTAEAFESLPSTIIPSDLYSNSTSEAAISQKIREIYLDEGETFSSNLTAFVKYYSDVLFNIGILKHAEFASKYVPVYQYQFSYFGRFRSEIPIDGIEKATHTSELPFILNIFGSNGDTDATNLLVQDQIVTLWTNFAKYLNPTPFETELLDNIIWPTLNNADLPYLNINASLEVQTNLGGHAYSSWNHIYETYGRKPIL